MAGFVAEQTHLLLIEPAREVRLAFSLGRDHTLQLAVYIGHEVERFTLLGNRVVGELLHLPKTLTETASFEINLAIIIRA